MPNFGDPLTGLNSDRPLTKEELIRAIRFMVAAEYEAIEMYGKVHDAAEDEKIKKAIMSIIEEEKVHAGEFMKMVTYLDPEEVKFYQKGFKETKEFLKSSSRRVLAKFLEIDAGYGTDVSKPLEKLRRIIQPKEPMKPADPNEPFAVKGEPVWILNKDGEFIKVPWNSKLEEIRKAC